MKAILIDDETLMLDLLDRKLNEVGGVTVVGKYTNPFEGLHEMATLKPDLVFLDIMMPELNGLDLAARIKEEFPYIKIIMSTAFEQYAFRAFEIQVDDYILKPYSDERLLKTIRRLSNNYVNNVNHKIIIRCFRNLSFGIEGDIEKRINVNWRTTKARELFSYLLHHRSEYIRKDILIDLFWRDSPTKDALGQLYSTIYQLRKSLEYAKVDVKVTSANGNYKLEHNGTMIDVDIWLNWIDSNPIVTKDNIEKHKKMLKLYIGDYFEEEDFQWTENERSRLRIKWLNLFKRVVDFLMQQFDYEEAILLYLHYQKVLPYYEDSYFALMKLYHLIGDRLSVRDQYHKLSDMLREEFNTEPNDEVEIWYAQRGG